MADTSNLTNFLQDVADAIKEKKEYDSSQKIAAADFDTEIASIETGIDTSDATATVNDVINPKTFYNANGLQVGGIAVVKEINDELKSISLTSDVQITTGPVFLFSDGKHIMVPCIVNNVRSFAIGVYDITNRTFKSIPNMIRTYDELNIASGASMMDSDLSRQESGTGNYYLIAKNKTNGNSYSLVAINFSTNTFEFKAQTTPESNTTYSAIFNPAMPNVFYYSKYDDWQYSTALAKRYDASTSSIVDINSSRHYGKSQSGWMRISQDGRLLVRSKQNDSGTVGYVLSTVDGGLRNTFGAGAGKLGITPDSKYMVCSSGIYSMTINGDTVTSTQLNTVNLPSRSWIIDYFFLGNTNKLLSSSGSVFDLYDVDYATGSYTLLDTVNYNSYSKSAPFPYMALNTGSTIALYGYFSTDTILQLTRDGKNLYYTAKDSDVISADILSGKIAYGTLGKITGTMLNNGALSYTPSTSQQIIPEGYTSGGTISAVDSTIDNNIVAENIKNGVTILGVTGNLEPDKPDQTKTVIPSTSQQIIEPDTGYELTSVTVNAVDSTIDSNIIAENIKSGVTILGVSGELEPSEEEINILELNSIDNVDVITEANQNILVLTEEATSYTELEYIGFTGTQYINTGIVPSNHKVIVDYSQEAYYSDDHLFGTGCTNDYNYFSFTFYNNNHYTIGFNGSQVQNIGTWVAGKHNLIFNYGDNHDIILDGNILYTGKNTASTANLLIGRRYATRLHANIYSFKIYSRNTDELVRDFIPVKDENNIVCLYDKISEQYFYNAGTGNFVAGPEKGGN